MKTIKVGEHEIPYKIVYGKYKGVSMRYCPKERVLEVKANRGYEPKRIVSSFMEQKKMWIAKQVALPWKYVSIGDKVDVFGKTYPVKVVLSMTDAVILRDDVCVVYTKKPLDEKSIEKRLRSFLKACLEDYVKHIYDEVTYKMGVYDVKIRYRYMTSRFGVCYPKKREICMNTYLACVSKECILAVFYHEFVHFYHANHGSEFYDVLRKIYPQYDTCMDSLKYLVLK